MFEETDQDKERLLAEFDGRAAAAQLHSSRVYFIDTETPVPVRTHRRSHNLTPLSAQPPNSARPIRLLPGSIISPPA
jgi:hypothetical protein